MLQPLANLQLMLLRTILVSMGSLLVFSAVYSLCLCMSVSALLKVAGSQQWLPLLHRILIAISPLPQEWIQSSHSRRRCFPTALETHLYVVNVDADILMNTRRTVCLTMCWQANYERGSFNCTSYLCANRISDDRAFANHVLECRAGSDVVHSTSCFSSNILIDQIQSDMKCLSVY